MKAKLLVLSLFLFSNILSAQFYDSTEVTTPGFLFKLEQDADGLFTVIAKSTVNLPELIVGSAQVSLVVPEGGITITDFVGYSGDWDDFILDKKSLSLENDYLFFGLRSPFNLENVKAGDEIKLLSFRNGAECIGPISLLQPTDPISIYTDINSGQDLSVIDGQTFDTYHFLETYGIDKIDCNDASSPIDMIVEVTATSARSATIEWTVMEQVVYYELEVRFKGTDNWEMVEKLNTSATKTYFYGPANKTSEGRIISHYKDGDPIISDIFTIETLLE